MWDETFYYANIAWCDSPFIDKIEEKKSQTAHYWLNDKTMFRIKKGNKKGFTCNYPTQTAMEVHYPQSELFDLVDKLEVTYVVSADETKIIDIAVVHRKYSAINFRFSILDMANVEALPQKDPSGEKDVAPDSVAKFKPGIEESDEIESTDDK